MEMDLDAHLRSIMLGTTAASLERVESCKTVRQRKVDGGLNKGVVACILNVSKLLLEHLKVPCPMSANKLHVGKKLCNLLGSAVHGWMTGIHIPSTELMRGVPVTAHRYLALSCMQAFDAIEPLV